MLHYSGWTHRDETFYVNECIENYLFDIIIIRCSEGYEPQFYDKGMCEIYRKYNSKYYIANNFNGDEFALKFMDQFIEKYNKLLVFM